MLSYLPNAALLDQVKCIFSNTKNKLSSKPKAKPIKLLPFFFLKTKIKRAKSKTESKIKMSQMWETNTPFALYFRLFFLIYKNGKRNFTIFCVPDWISFWIPNIWLTLNLFIQADTKKGNQLNIYVIYINFIKYFERKFPNVALLDGYLEPIHFQENGQVKL